MIEIEEMLRRILCHAHFVVSATVLTLVYVDRCISSIYHVTDDSQHQYLHIAARSSEIRMSLRGVKIVIKGRERAVGGEIYLIAQDPLPRKHAMRMISCQL